MTSLPSMSEDERSFRDRLLNFAYGELGTSDPTEYWLDAYGSLPQPSTLAWCGVFVLWVLRQMGLTSRQWIAGRGFLYVDDKGHSTKAPWLPLTTDPQPGDIAYFDKPYQHYAMVIEVVGDEVQLVAGNTPNVSSYPKPLSAATDYYSISPLVQRAVTPVAASAL